MRALDSICATFPGGTDSRATVSELHASVNLNCRVVAENSPYCLLPPGQPKATAAGSTGDFAQRLQLGLEDILLPFQPAEFDEQGLAFGAGRACNLIAEALQVALKGLEFGFDRPVVELVRRQRLVGEHRTALRC